MQTQQSIPLSKLFLSPLNTRQTNEDSDLSNLLPLVRTQGLLQRLVVVPATPEEKKQKKGDFGVVAGGRRLFSLKKLASDKEIKPNMPIDCLVVPITAGIAASIAENSARTNLHPADELIAFRTLVESGTSIEDVAATFGVTPLVVERRLRLTTLSPRLIDEYRKDAIRLDQLQALALTDDHTAQETAWFETPEWEHDPQRLRRMLVQEEPKADSDRRMRFVGLDTYLAAGGRLRRDLFEEHSGYVLDVGLLDHLARDAMVNTQQKLESQGWNAVHLMPAAHGYNAHTTCTRLRPSLREPTKKEAKELAKVEKRIAQIDEVLQAEEENPEVDYDALSDERDELQEKVGRIESAREEFSDKQRARSGVVVSLDADGSLHYDFGVVPRPTGPAPGSGSGSLVEDDASPSVRDKGPRSAHSEKLVAQLTAHRSAALQAVLTDNPHFALVGLLATMVPRVFDYEHGQSDTGLCISTSPSLHSLRHKAEDLDTSKAVARLSEVEAQWSKRLADAMPTDAAEEDAGGHDGTRPDPLIAWLMAQTTDTLLSLLAYCVGSTVDVTSVRETEHKGEAFAQAVGLNMAQWWTATAGSYFRHVAKPTILAAVGEACPTPPAGLAVMKKEPLAAAAETAIAGSNWLPSPLRVG